jgi:SAM-dependent methyltransferase
LGRRTRAALAAAVLVGIIVNFSCSSGRFEGNAKKPKRAFDGSIGKASQKRRSLIETIQENVARGETQAGHTYYSDEYRVYEAFFWYKIAGWMVEDAVERRSTDLKGPFQILDLGCGYGTLLSFATIIYGAAGICLDQASTLFPNMSETYDVTYVYGDIEGQPLPSSGIFQVLIMTEVLEHFNFKPVPTLRKIREALAPNGSFFLSTPDAEGGWGRKLLYFRSLPDAPSLDLGRKRVDDHIWHYNELELTAVLQEAGFKIKRLERTENRGRKHFNVWLQRHPDPR